MGQEWFDTYIGKLSGAVDPGVLARLTDDRDLRDIVEGRLPTGQDGLARIAQVVSLLDSARSSFLNNNADPTLLGGIEQLQALTQAAQAAALSVNCAGPKYDASEPSADFDESINLDVVGHWPP